MISVVISLNYALRDCMHVSTATIVGSKTASKNRARSPGISLRSLRVNVSRGLMASRCVAFQTEAHSAVVWVWE